MLRVSGSFSSPWEAENWVRILILREDQAGDKTQTQKAQKGTELINREREDQEERERESWMEVMGLSAQISQGGPTLNTSPGQGSVPWLHHQK